MMVSILNLERPVREVDPVDAANGGYGRETPSGSSEYELVLGRAQIASWMFVTVIAVAVCSSLAYVVGEAISAQRVAQSAPPPTPTAAISAPLPEAIIQVPPRLDVSSTQRPAIRPVPLFAEPEAGKVYLQIGAVDRGMAMLLAEGLRSHGLDSFVAPGPTDKIFRVLIGPLPDPAAFRQAMTAVAVLDLDMFARKYQK